MTVALFSIPYIFADKIIKSCNKFLLRDIISEVIPFQIVYEHIIFDILNAGDFSTLIKAR